MSSFCTAKATHIFSAKNFSIFAYHSVNFNESFTNDIISFEQLGPDLFVQYREASSYEPLLFICNYPVLWSMLFCYVLFYSN